MEGPLVAPAELGELYASIRKEMGRLARTRVRKKPFHVSYRAYAGLTSVIRDRDTHYDVRLSEILHDAPLEVHVSLARDLVSRLNRKWKLAPYDLAAYQRWSSQPHIQAAHEEARRRRGHKRMRHPYGHVHDLNALFDRLNAQYFEGILRKPRLGWSLQRSRGQYGHHDPVHDAIVLNSLLDHPRVPDRVVASILFHEMLHIKHGIGTDQRGRHVYHPPAFRHDEKLFREAKEANAFLRRLESRKVRLRFPVTPRRAPVPEIAPDVRMPPASPVTQTDILSNSW